MQFCALLKIDFDTDNYVTVRYSILLAAMLGLASFYPVWLIQPYMQSINVPLVWFGPIWAVANLCVSFGSLLSYRIQYHDLLIDIHVLHLLRRYDRQSHPLQNRPCRHLEHRRRYD